MRRSLKEELERFRSEALHLLRARTSAEIAARAPAATEAELEAWTRGALAAGLVGEVIIASKFSRIPWSCRKKRETSIRLPRRDGLQL